MTRLAEVALAQGDARAAIASATRARSLAPTQSAPLVVLGFANLRAFDTAAAESAFAQAVELEPEAPLPRLGLALALDPTRRARRGRRQLELAVALDPANPLTRSYMAKVYDAENRGDLTASQLDLAKEFDPVDPTPWLYSSLQNLRANRPVEALQDLQLAAQKNDNRPIFRSWLSLDEDVATRSAGLGRVHNELGFGRLALLDAWQAIGDDPTNFAAHRLLADGYSTEPWHEIARVSELLVSQLLQPANSRRSSRSSRSRTCSSRNARGRATRRSTSSLRRSSRTASSSAPRLSAAATAASGDDVSLAGLHDRVSYSVGHYRFATDGFRTNNDLEQEVANAFLQFRPSHETNLQAELRSSRTEHGDLTMYFNRESIRRRFGSDEDADSLRFGAKHQFSPNHILLGSLILQDVAASSRAAAVFRHLTAQNAHNVDVQDTVRVGQTIVQSGFVSTQQDENCGARRFSGRHGPSRRHDRDENRQLGVYSYVTLNPTATLTLTAGASCRYLRNRRRRRRRGQPQARPRLAPDGAHDGPRGRVRDAVQRPDDVEPEHAAAPRASASGRLHTTPLRRERRSKRPSAVSLSSTSCRRTSSSAGRPTRETQSASSSVPFADSRTRANRAPRTRAACLSVLDAARAAERQRALRARALQQRPASELFGYSHMNTARLPLEVRYFSRGGLTVGARASHVQQEGEFQMTASVTVRPPDIAPGARSLLGRGRLRRLSLAQSPRPAVSQRRQLARRELPASRISIRRIRACFRSA